MAVATAVGAAQCHACMGCGGMPSTASSTTTESSSSSCSLLLQQQASTAGTSGAGAAEGAVEMDPSRRYIRYPLLLGRGACKRVYKAFDLQEGIEVAWNKAELSGHDLDPEQQERLFSEIRVLKSLKHRNIITCYHWWHDAASQTINFITELFTSGTLRQYRKKHLRHISDSAIKRWAFQILEGLLYLHAHSPAIVHRDLKCDNILVNGTSGQVKIADLGLASCQRGMSVVGTPEFMAPEMYDEVYDEKVDIYAFGMCMLELATLEYPYSECRSIPAIFMRVSKGIPPAALSKVSSDSLRELITTCIVHDPQQRPGALQLLKHPFFADLADKPAGSPTYGGAGATSRHSTCFTPPFGSCGNLMALSHGSIGQQQATSHVREAHSQQQESSSSTSSDGGSSSNNNSTAGSGGCCTGPRQQSAGGAEGSSAARTAAAGAAAAVAQYGSSVLADGCSSASAQLAATADSLAALTIKSSSPKSARFAPLPVSPGHSAFAASSSSARASDASSTSGASMRSSSGSSCGSSSSFGAHGAGTTQAAKAVGRAVAAAAGGAARGTTVCVAKVLRGPAGNRHEDEDSDEEVLVSLEDVLVPHPEDFTDAHALGLTTQLTHAGSGCTIMSGPGYQLGEGLSGLLDHMALSAVSFVAGGGNGVDGDGLLSRLSSNAAGLQQHQQQQELASQQPPEQQQQQAVPAGGAAAVSGSLSNSSSPGGKIPSRPSSRLASISGAAPSILQAVAPQSAATGARPVSAGASVAVGGNGGGSPASNRVSSSSGVVSPLVSRPASASAASQSSASASAAVQQLLHSFSALAGSSHTRSINGGSGGSNHSSAGGGGILTAGQAAGALAAAGLLQLSPGCYVPTPRLLEKLLSKAGGASSRNGGGGAASSAAGGANREWGSTAGVASSTAGGTGVVAAAAAAGGHVPTATTAAGTAAVADAAAGVSAQGASSSPAAGFAVPAAMSAQQAGGVQGAQRPHHCRCGSREAINSSSSSGNGMAGGVGVATTEQTGAEAVAVGASAGPAAVPAAAARQQAPDSVLAVHGQCDAQQDAVAVITASSRGAKGTDSTSSPAGGAVVVAPSASLCCGTSHRLTADGVDCMPVVGSQATELVELGEPAALAPAEAAAATAAAPAQAGVGGGHGGGGFGRILVRRRFVKFLQQQQQHQQGSIDASFKRWNTL